MHPGPKRRRTARWLLLLATAAVASACMGDTRPRVVIEWGVAAEELEGAEVLIDGAVAGRLTRFGEATRTSFPAAKGEHVVAIRHPKIECEAARVTTSFAGQRLLLIAQFRESAGPGGELRSVLSLQP